ncbi:MAG: type II secretion system protein GspD [Planctomycetota bacterium]
MYDNKNSNSKTKMGKHLFVWGFVLIVAAAIAVADIGQGQMFAQADEGLDAANIDISSSQADASVGGTLQSIKFNKDEGIKEALRILNALYQKNIVPSATVDGILGFTTLKDVSFEEAMDAILGHNFVYEQKGNLVRVYTKDEYQKIKEDKSRMICEVFTLYYITAEEARKLITPVLSKSGLVEVSTAAEAQISSGGGSSSGGGGGSVGSGGGGGNSMALHDTIVVYDFPENITDAKGVIKFVDVRPKQVLVEATILSVLLTEGLELGVDLNFAGGTVLDGTAATDTLVAGSTVDRGTEATSPIVDIAGGVPGSALEIFGFATAGGDGLRVGVKSGDISAFITALESVTDTTVIANPKILAVNKQEGCVLIGRNLGYRSSTSISEGVATQGQVEFLQTGTQLIFRPYIANDGYIRMDIYPKDSTAELNDDGVPDETTTELKTNILVKDGETIVIGGLFRDVVVSTRKQIPLLGDLPIIGAAFRSTDDTTQRQEVIIMLTPHIINGADQTRGLERAADISRKRYGAQDGVMWTSRSRLADDYYERASRYYVEGDTEAAMKELEFALTFRPTYLEAIRLKERIIAETKPDEVQNMERILLDNVEREDTDKWLRR